MWIRIFSLSKQVVDHSQPLTREILSDSNHDVVKTIIYIYTMESFIFTELNKASRNKDATKIKYFGAFAAALSYIVHCGNDNEIENDEL